MEDVDCHHSKDNGSSIEHVEVPLGGDDPTIPAICEFDRSVNRPAHTYVSIVMIVSKSSTNLITTRDVLIPIPIKRSPTGFDIRTEPPGRAWRVAVLSFGLLPRAGRST